MSTAKESPEQVNEGEPKTVHPTFQVGRALRNPRPDLKPNQIAFLLRVSFELGFGKNPDVGPYEFRQAPEAIAVGLGFNGKHSKKHVADIRTELKKLGIITMTNPGDEGQRIPPTYRINVSQLSNHDVPSTDSTTYRPQTPRRTGGGRDDGGAVAGTLVRSGTEGTSGTYTVPLPSASQPSNATGLASFATAHDGSLADGTATSTSPQPSPRTTRQARDWTTQRIRYESKTNFTDDEIEVGYELFSDIRSELSKLYQAQQIDKNRSCMILHGIARHCYTIGSELLQRQHHTEAADKHRAQTINEWIQKVVLVHSKEDPKHYADMLIDFIRGKEMAVYGQNRVVT